MTLKKPLIVGAIILSGLTLAGCSNNKSNDNAEIIATMKGKQVNSQELYSDIKTNTYAQSAIKDALVTDAFNQLYADKVSDKTVNSLVSKAKASYGDNFKSILTSNNMTENEYIETLKKQAVVEYGLRQNIDVSKADMEKTWKNFHPESNIQIAKFNDEAKAKDFAKNAKTGDFVGLANKSAVNKNDIATKVDSGSDTIPTEVHTQLWKLKNGEISNVITTTDSSYQSTYYVVKMVKLGDKGSDMKKHEKRIKEITQNSKLTNADTMNATIGKVLKKANFQMKDKDLSTLMTSYLSTK